MQKKYVLDICSEIVYRFHKYYLLNLLILMTNYTNHLKFIN